jgi:hypothetical protein
MLSDALLDLRQRIEEGIRSVRQHQANHPDLYDPLRPQIDAAVAAVEATLPQLEALRASVGKPPDAPVH